ncbi:MAG: 50S ribosome-binding GTPase [Candidatus Omnitrophica bacterium]|nr:50S ribosome-binding GTPase [Candidatus Omnitrophota bacterium]
MIIDEVKVYLKAGDGGRGEVSMLRFSNRRVIGGGGDGGKGADIILRTSPHLYDLNKFLLNKKFIAEDGERGRSNNKKGKDAKPLIIDVPVGTIVKDLEGNIIVDLDKESQQFIICKGGEGGKGNFKKEYSILPTQGEEKEVIFDYRIPNDIAIVGFANVGKTSLFNALTGKSFKVADWPFTTTHCMWAPFLFNFFKITVLDTPAIKINADNKFLKHLFRTKIIIFISDNFSNCSEDFSLLKNEISKFDKQILNDKKIFYLLNKIDKIDKIQKMQKILTVSAQQNIRIEKLKEKIFKELKNEKSSCKSWK